MLKGNEVKILEYDAFPSFEGQIGTIHNFREVGLKATNIEYEYLIRLDAGYFWIPDRYLEEVTT